MRINVEFGGPLSAETGGGEMRTKTDPTMRRLLEKKAEIDACVEIRDKTRDNDERTAAELRKYALQLDIIELILLATVKNYLTSATQTTTDR